MNLSMIQRVQNYTLPIIHLLALVLPSRMRRPCFCKVANSRCNVRYAIARTCAIFFVGSVGFALISFIIFSCLSVSCLVPLAPKLTPQPSDKLPTYAD